MAKKSTVTVTLSMTLEEAKIVARALCGKVLELKEDIAMGDRITESNICVAAAQKARERLPMVESLWLRAERTYTDAFLACHEEDGARHG